MNKEYEIEKLLKRVKELEIEVRNAQMKGNNKKTAIGD